VEAELTPSDDRAHAQVAIIGTGFGGLGAAIRLRQEGVRDVVLFERANEVGGTWRDNSYPGCSCDVQSHLYSFSFAPNPDWGHSFSPQSEIWAYLRRCARDFGVLPHIRFNHTVTDAAWDDAAAFWRIETSRGSYTADALVMAAGALSEPVVPHLRGLERFRGKTFHSARWDHDYDLTGRRVAVVGTGASAIQFVPEIQPAVERLSVFQRTPPWIIPRNDRALTGIERHLFRRFPLTQRAARSSIYLFRELFLLGFRYPGLARLVEAHARLYLRRSVADPSLRKKLTPDYRIGCKRILLSNDYLPALTRANVEVVSEAIEEVREHSIVDAAGAERETDAIIFGTGFRATDPPFARSVRGRDGRNLAEVWAGSPRAHLGTTVTGFPNFFMLMGPNTGLGHSSVVLMMEAQIEHVIAALKHMRREGASAIEPHAAAQSAFVAEVERRMEGTVWTAGGCASWYMDSTGRNAALWPDFTWRFRRRAVRLDPEEYALSFPGGARGRPAASFQPVETTREANYA
jgi:cation diffusion facilitator CzcD-associated flavoprotein CzcO